MSLEAVRVIILAKAPIAGFAKTRLIPAIGKDNAALVAQKLLIHAVTEVASTSYACCLQVVPGPAHADWDRYRETINEKFENQIVCVEKTGNADQDNTPVDHSNPLVWSEQCEGDLGHRLSGAVASVTSDKNSKYDDHPVIVMGTDCPAITASLITEAGQLLKDYDAVLLPVEDGGYGLIGMRTINDEVFREIRWSTQYTADDTRKQMQKLGWRWYEFDVVSDIDEATDLQHLPNGWLDDLGIGISDTVQQ